ncbi:hypothetical protein BGW42_006515 [Actinomortierella wolfii]|nr:hypothetical protein BGW42_006515 [Actinomortierella wolfii]
MKFGTSLSVSLSIVSLAWITKALPTTDSQKPSLSSNAYLIEFATPPGHPLAEQDATKFLDKIKGLKSVRVRHQFKTLLNGVSVEITDPAELHRVQTMGSLHALTPLAIVALPEHSQSSTNVLVTDALKLTNTDRVHSELGLTGKGIKIGVIDSGIDYTHKALGGCFGPGCKVAFGWDFAGDDFTGENDPKPSGDPMDCRGHGTHVAGTIGANDSTVLGVAPGAILGAYRVFGCNGTTTNDIIIAAMEKAVNDGMDVINMSLGEPNGWIGTPVSKAVSRASKLGVLFAAAQGNEGNEGLFSANYVGEGTGVLAVASFINTRITLPYFATALEPSKKILYTAAEGTGELFPVPQPMAALLNGTSLSLACDPLPTDVNLESKIVLVSRGTCLFKIKAQNVLDRGAVAVIFVNNVAGSVTASVENVTITSGSISNVDGMRIVDLLQQAGPTEQNGYLTASTTVTFSKEPAVLMNPAGGTVSGFTSHGPDNNLHLKPDIGAPGENIYSTWMTNNGSYVSISGTSMASPQVAGALALALESLRTQGITQTKAAVGEKLVRRIYDAFINSAKPARVYRNHVAANLSDMPFDDGTFTSWPIEDESQLIESAAKQGGGMMDVYTTVRRLGKPLLTTESSMQPEVSPFTYTQVLPATLELNDTAQGESLKLRTLTIYNQASVAMQYEISHLPAEALNEPLIEPHPAHVSWSKGDFNELTPLINAVQADAVVQIPMSQVTVPAGGKRRISVLIGPPASLPSNEHWVYSGYIVVKPVVATGATPTAPADAIHVPYVGVKGSMKTLPIFLQTTPEHEIISSNKSQLCQTVATVIEDKIYLIFTMEGKDVPIVIFCVQNPTRLLQLDLLDGNGTTVIGHIGTSEHVARKEPTNPLEMFAWDGMFDPPGSGSKSSSTILDDSGLDTTSLLPFGRAQPVNLDSENFASSFTITKRGTTIRQRALKDFDENEDGNRVPVGDGTYRFRIRGLKLFGDETKEEDYETWIFPPFAVVRP